MTKVSIALISIFVLVGAALSYIAFNTKTPTPRPISSTEAIPEYKSSAIDLKTVGFIFDRQMSKKYLQNLIKKTDDIQGVVKVKSLSNQMTIEVTYDPIGISEEQLRTRVSTSINPSTIVKIYHANTEAQ